MKKVRTACSRNSYKIVPLTNLNKYLYNGGSEIKVNTNNNSEKFRTICCYISMWQKSMQYKTWQCMFIILYIILTNNNSNQQMHIKQIKIVRNIQVSHKFQRQGAILREPKIQSFASTNTDLGITLIKGFIYTLLCLWGRSKHAHIFVPYAQHETT